jgi:hypothetical protein
MVLKESAKKLTSKSGTVLYATVNKKANCNAKFGKKDPGVKECAKVVYVSTKTANERNIPDDGFLSDKEIEEWQKKLRSEKAKARKKPATP